MNNKILLNFNDIKERRKYDKNIKVSNTHLGQLKLLLVELRFFTDIDIVNIKDEIITILYIGSGKGFHIPLLIKALNNINKKIYWHFYDPNGHCEKLNILGNNINIFIKNQLFLTEDIEKFKQNIKNTFIFISDIRSCDDVEPNTDNLIFDYKIHKNILETLKPDYSLLKARYPFPDDFTPKQNEEINELIPLGTEYLQPFSPVSSSELRIILKKNQDDNSYIYKKITVETIEDYEEKMFWYNTSYRSFKTDLNLMNYILNNLDKNIKKNIGLNKIQFNKRYSFLKSQIF